MSGRIHTLKSSSQTSEKSFVGHVKQNTLRGKTMIILLTSQHGLEVWVLSVSEGVTRTALSYNSILSIALSI
jgi:hypothetical protein